MKNQSEMTIHEKHNKMLAGSVATKIENRPKTNTKNLRQFKNSSKIFEDCKFFEDTKIFKGK